MTTEEKLKAAAAIIGVLGLLIGFYQFIEVQSIKAAEPYLQKKLDWCEDAVMTAAAISVAPQPDPAKVQKFMGLYWGVMGLIENDAIRTAMDGFRQELANPSTAAESKVQPTENEGLTQRSLDLAHACRDELSREWSVKWARQ